MTRSISLAVLLILILLLGSMMFQVIAPFILPLFVAAVLAVISQPLHQYFLRETGQRTAWAAAFSTSAVMAIVVVPVILGTFSSGLNLYTYANEKFDGEWQIAVKKIRPLIPHGPWDSQIENVERQIRRSLRSFVKQIAPPAIVRTENDSESADLATSENESSDGELIIPENELAIATNPIPEIPLNSPAASSSSEPRPTVGAASVSPATAAPDEEAEPEEGGLPTLFAHLAGPTFQIASSIIGRFVAFSIAAGTFITALYYFLADGPELIAAAEKMIPLPVDYQRRLCDQFARVVRAVVTATFLAALIQGIATATALWFCGYDQFLIVLGLATVASLIPLIGAWIVWLPCAVWLAVNEQWMAAILLTLWGAFVVSMLDNVVKMYVLQNNADLHPLLAFISVIGALQVLGVWGIFIGPIVASCLFALIQIFNTELQELAKERELAKGVSPPLEASVPGASPVQRTVFSGPPVVAAQPSARTQAVRPRGSKSRRKK